MSIDTLIADMQERGWDVTFPAFERTRAFGVKATKGDKKYGTGWLPNRNTSSLEEAIARLSRETERSDGSQSMRDEADTRSVNLIDTR
jgi:hypothetical protein